MVILKTLIYHVKCKFQIILLIGKEFQETERQCT